MEQGAGVILIAAATAVGLVDVFVLWTRLPASAALAVLSVAGIALGVGALLLQGNVGAANWVITTVGLALLGPVHLRAVFGPPGPPRRHAEGLQRP